MPRWRRAAQNPTLPSNADRSGTLNITERHSSGVALYLQSTNARTNFATWS